MTRSGQMASGLFLRAQVYLKASSIYYSTSLASLPFLVGYLLISFDKGDQPCGAFHQQRLLPWSTALLQKKKVFLAKLLTRYIRARVYADNTPHLLSSNRSACTMITTDLRKYILLSLIMPAYIYITSALFIVGWTGSTLVPCAPLEERYGTPLTNKTVPPSPSPFPATVLSTPQPKTIKAPTPTLSEL